MILINPKYDCSDKELHQRNGFKSAGKNLHSFFSNGDKAVFVEGVFKPDRLGEFTKDDQGQIKHTILEARRQNFEGKLANFGAD